MTEQPFTIGRLAKKAGVNIETIRHYQRVGLVTEPTKPVSGYRIYPDKYIARLQFIKRAKKVGFSLREIIELLALDDAHCADVRHLAEDKRNKIVEQIQELGAIKNVLDNMINACKGSEQKHYCAMFEALSASDKNEVK